MTKKQGKTRKMGLTIEQIPIALLKPYENNAKQHPEKQIELLARNIEEFGFTTPVLVDKHNSVIAGHGRLLALQRLGWENAPCVRLENLNAKQVKALRLADNKIAEMGEWDMGLALEELKELDEELFALTGFDPDLLIEGDEQDDAVPTDAPARAKPGDLWQLGEHRLLVGDATKTNDWKRLMAGSKADMVFTDPPYNVDYKGMGKKKRGILNDNLDDAAFLAFLDDTFSCVLAAVKPAAGLYVFHAAKTQAIFEQAMHENDFQILSQLIWNKPSAGLGQGDYRAKHEPFFYAVWKDHAPQFYGNRSHATIVDFQKTEEELMKWAVAQKKAERDGRTTIWTMKRAPVAEYVHPTQKPVELVLYALRNSSKAGDIVLDPFLGSGTTLIACQKAERVCYGMELDPKFADAIIARWEEYTGGKARKMR